MNCNEAPEGAMAALCAELDRLEAAAWDRVGGSCEAEEAVIDAAEARVYATAESATREERVWLAQRLVRAEDNEWCDEAKAPLIAAMRRAGMLVRRLAIDDAEDVLTFIDSLVPADREAVVARW